MKKQFILIVFVLLLTACVKQVTPIAPPSNISYQDELLTWDGVPEATGYQCLIGRFVYEVSTAEFDTSELLAGSHDVKIITLKESEYSEPSEKYTFTIIRDLVAPSNIRIDGTTLLWDEVPLAIGYIVDINGVQAGIEAISYSLGDLPSMPSMTSLLPVFIRMTIRPTQVLFSPIILLSMHLRFGRLPITKVKKIN
jgi:hypothetical protein